MIDYGQLGEVESMFARAVRGRCDLGPHHARVRTLRGLGQRDRSARAGTAVRGGAPRAGVPRRLGDRCADVGTGPNHLDDEFTLVADTFRRFGEEQVRPHAEHVHRANADVPESIISGLAEIGGFGLSVPEEYGGFATGGESDYMGMVVSTEELSRASLGIGGSLITRPEILTRAVVAGGTEEQKQAWLPRSPRANCSPGSW